MMMPTILHVGGVLAILLIDQWLKYLAWWHCANPIPLITTGMGDVTCIFTTNPGFSFGLGGSLPTFLHIAAPLILLMFVVHEGTTRLRARKNAIPEMLILAGGMGNLADRAFYGHVFDYLLVTLFGFEFPVFNFADCAVVGGVFLLLVREARERGWL